MRDDELADLATLAQARYRVHVLADIRGRIAAGASLPDAVEADELIAGGR